jgi:hypothetical protein
MRNERNRKKKKQNSISGVVNLKEK